MAGCLLPSSIFIGWIETNSFKAMTGGLRWIFCATYLNNPNSPVHTMWGPRSISKLVNITPMSLWFMVLINYMVFGTYNELVTGANLNQRSHHWGASWYIVMIWYWWFTSGFFIFRMPNLNDMHDSETGALWSNMQTSLAKIECNLMFFLIFVFFNAEALNQNSPPYQ
jgi:hypothetical protein